MFITYNNELIITKIGDIDVNDENVWSLLNVADMYLVQALKKQCCTFLGYVCILSCSFSYFFFFFCS